MTPVKGITYKLTFPTDAETIAVFEKEETFPATGGPSIFWYSRQSGDNFLCGHFPKEFVPENWFHIPSFLMNQLKVEEVSDGTVIEDVEPVTGNEIKACEGILARIAERRKDPGIDTEKLNDMEKQTREIMKEFEEMKR